MATAFPWPSKKLEGLPLRDLGVDPVVDCTSAFKTGEKVQPYHDTAVKKVLISAPIKWEPALNLINRVNHTYHQYQRLAR